MTFWGGLRQTYIQSWRFMIAVPLIAVAVIGFEGLQHVVEWRAGLYVSPSAMRANAEDPGRLLAGLLKVGWILIVIYWTSRYFASRSVRATLAFDPAAIRKFAWFFLTSAALSLVVILGPAALPAMGAARHAAGLALALFEIASFPIGLLLTPWGVGAALGDARAGPVFGFRRARGSVLWGCAFALVAPLPLLIAHYALGYGAAGRSPAIAISLLTVDAVLTGFLGVATAMSQAVLAERMAERAGERLAIGGRASPPAP